jgi:trimeric autotransporter adhesin
VYQPNGAILTTNAYLTGSYSSSGTLQLPNLPTSGTYTVVMSTGGGEPGTAQLTLTSQTITSNDQSSVFDGYQVGQSAEFTFSANAGDNLELLLTGMSIGSNYRTPATVSVFDPNGTNVASGQCYDAWYSGTQNWVPTCRLPLWNLVQGTYTVVITPPDSSSWFYGFNASLQADTVGPALSLNTAATPTLSLGQVERMTFTGNAGDNLALNVANVSTTNTSGQSVQFSVYQPNGAILTTNAYLTGSYTSSGTLQLPNLPTSGTYTVVMSTAGGEPGTAQLTLTSQTITSNDQSSVFDGYQVGQSAEFTFSANAGDNLELLLTGMSIGSNYRTPATVSVFDPNGTNVASGQCYDAWYSGTQNWVPTCRLPLWNLVQGTYTVVITPPDSASWFYGFNASLQADTVGPVLSLDTAATVTLGLGQVERLTFTGNAGDNHVLSISDVSTTNTSGQAVQVAVYGPDGSIMPNNAYVSGQYTGSGTLSMTNLPVSGTYTVLISTVGGEPCTAQLMLQ